MFVQYGNLRHPPFPGVRSPSALWHGIGEDSGKAVFVLDGQCILSDQLAPRMQVHGSANGAEIDETLSPVYTDVNGFGYWASDNYTLAHSPAGEWTFSTLPPYTAPREYTITSAKRYYEHGEYIWRLSALPAGDPYFTGTPPTVGGGALAWTPRGVYRTSEASAELSVSAFWPHWERRAEPSDPDDYAGAYNRPCDGPGEYIGSATVGFPSWGTSGEYVRSLYPNPQGYYDYPPIRANDAGKYISGAVGPNIYYMGDPPSAGESWELSGYVRRDGETVPSGEVTLPWYGYTMGSAVDFGMGGDNLLCH